MFKRLIIKYKNLPMALKSSIWFTFSNFLQKGISVLATPLYTRLLTKEEFGFFSVYQSWFDILLIFATLNLSAGVMINALNKCGSDEEKNKVTSNFQILEIIIMLIVMMVVISINTFTNDIFGMPTFIILLLFIQILSQSGVSLWLTQKKFDFKYVSPVVINLIASCLNVGLSILFIKNASNKTYSLVYGTVLACAIPYLVLVFINLLKGKSINNLKLWKYALKFNLPLLSHYLSLIILGTSDRIMIERFCGLSDTSLYTVAYNIARIINLFCTGMNAALAPWIYKKMNVNEHSDIKKVSNILLIFILFVSLIVMLLGPEALFILGDESYIEAKIVIPPIIAGLFYMFLYPLFGNVEFYFEKRLVTMIASVVCAIVNVVTNAIFIPIYGYVAAAYTTLGCYILLSLFHFISYKVLIKNMKINYIYDIKLIVLCCFIILAVIPAVYVLYLNDIVRYVIVGIIFIAISIFIIIFYRVWLKKNIIKT